jgi:hypothetical protein
MPADAALAGDMAMPDEPELLLPDGELVSAGGVDGMAEGLVDGVVDGVVVGEVEGALIGAGVVVSSTFLPQAPSANSAESAITVVAGLNWTEFIRLPIKNGLGKVARPKLSIY